MLQKILKGTGKIPLTNFFSVVKYIRYAKTIKEKKQIRVLFKREGDSVSPLRIPLQAASFVAREDRDGCSRYRVSKISFQKG